MNRVASQYSFFRNHPLTRGRPLAAFGRFLSWQLKSRVRQENEFKWIEGSKLLVKRGMTGATGNIYCGLHEFADMAFLLHLLKPGDLFGDVGANIGSYTILASAVSGADVVAVEPDPDTAERLRINVALNRCELKVSVAEVAVADREGTIQFSKGLDTMNKIVTGVTDGQTRKVSVTTLDALFSDRAPVMLKLDVEGFELLVLNGASRLLRQPQLLAVETETTVAPVRKILYENGFVEQHYNPFSRMLSSQREIRHSNGLFVKNTDAVGDRIRTAKRFRVLNHWL